jgi:predicted nucleic acid-binding protein
VSAIVVDTSVWIDSLARGASPALADALLAGEVHLPPVVAAELLSGKLSAVQRARLESFLGDLPWCVADRDHWFRVGRLRADLRSRGMTASAPDTHVAQCALDLDAELWTLDRVFAQIARYAALRVRAAST